MDESIGASDMWASLPHRGSVETRSCFRFQSCPKRRFDRTGSRLAQRETGSPDPRFERTLNCNVRPLRLNQRISARFFGAQTHFVGTSEPVPVCGVGPNVPICQRGVEVVITIGVIAMRKSFRTKRSIPGAIARTEGFTIVGDISDLSPTQSLLRDVDHTARI